MCSRYVRYASTIHSSANLFAIEMDGWKFDMTRPADYVVDGSGSRDMDVYHQKMIESFGKSSAILIMASNRPEYLHRCLEHILRYHPRIVLPIIVSEDGENPIVSQVVHAAISLFHELAPDLPFIHLQHPPIVSAENAYIKLSGHFKWALTQAFDNPFPNPNHSTAIDRLIIVEEDLEIASDFYEYFAAMVPMLDHDNQIFAVSAWNDNGQSDFVRDPQAVYRSDFFPGLGWMLHRKIWKELQGKWPRGYWDDWLREPVQRQGRHILRPEICRTFHYGSHGVSNAQYSEYLNRIQLNQKYIPFLDLNLSYLDRYVDDRRTLSLEVG
jgi:alpha-1,3-mannosyl-glycoprotein beta-1,2-N-acetylglucosaminyltransferase